MRPFTFVKYSDLETRVTGHSRPLKMTAFNRSKTDFLLMFNSNYGSIVHFF